MSWWTDIRDTTESAFSTVSPIDVRGKSARKKDSGIGGAFNKVRDVEEGTVNKILGKPSQADIRAQQQLITDQINAYKEQTELTKKELEETQAEEESQKRKVQEKQIRALRRSSSAPSTGLLGSGQSDTDDMNSKLGG